MTGNFWSWDGWFTPWRKNVHHVLHWNKVLRWSDKITQTLQSRGCRLASILCFLQEILQKMQFHLLGGGVGDSLLSAVVSLISLEMSHDPVALFKAWREIKGQLWWLVGKLSPQPGCGACSDWKLSLVLNNFTHGPHIPNWWRRMIFCWISTA